MTTTATTTRRPGGVRRAVSGAAPARATLTASGRSRGRAFTIVSAVVLVVFALLWLAPSLFALKTSLTTNGTAALGAPAILGDFSPTLYSFASIFGIGDIWNWYVASALTSVLATLITIVVASMAAFSLSRLRFRGRTIALLLIVIGIIVPTQVLILPIYQELSALGLLNTYWAVILPQVPAAIAVFIFKQFFDGIPKELEEAARIDGASRWRVYRSVIMPLSRPVVAAVSIFTFVNVWNNLLLPLFTISNPNLMTIPVGLATVQGSFGQRYADIQAGALLGALPLIIIYVIFQRQIVEGVTGSGLKG